MKNKKIKFIDISHMISIECNYAPLVFTIDRYITDHYHDDENKFDILLRFNYETRYCSIVSSKREQN